MHRATIKKKKNKKKKKKNKPQHENIYGLPIPSGDQKKLQKGLRSALCSIGGWYEAFKRESELAAQSQ